MKKTWLEIYGLMVCAFALACLVFVLGSAAWDVVEISAPEFALPDYEWQRHQSDDVFKEFLTDQRSRMFSPEGIALPQVTIVAPEGAALSEARALSSDRVIRSLRRAAFQDLVRNVIALVIGMAVFLVHWRIATRARQTA